MLIDVAGHTINAAQILWVEDLPESGGKLSRCRVHFVGGETLTVQAHSLAFDAHAGTVIAAPPGYSVIHALIPHRSDPDRTIDFDVEPVLAFRYRGANGDMCVPITPQGQPGDHFAIVYPDGSCRDAEGTYEDTEAYKAAFRARVAKHPTLIAV